MGDRLDGAMSARDFVDSMIRVGLIAALVYWCHQIFEPFMNLMLWSVVLAVALYPLQRKLMARLGGRNGWAATLLVLIGMVCLIVPLALLTDSLLSSAQAGLQSLKGDGIDIPAPPAKVQQWPVIGDSLFSLWSHAAEDTSWAMQQLGPYFKTVSKKLLLQLAGVGTAVLLLIVALVISGFIIAAADSGQRTATAIAIRFAGPVRGPNLVTLCTATIRAVAQGVVGIAFIQMVMIGMALVAMDIPGAGVLALLVLLAGIAQLPVILVTLPIIIFVISQDGVTAVTVAFAIWMLIGGLIDNVLKPLLLGRGVEVPMPVVLFGAIGGMLSSGVIGLFIGPVILAVGYQLFMAWVYQSTLLPPSEG